MISNTPTPEPDRTTTRRGVIRAGAAAAIAPAVVPLAVSRAAAPGGDASSPAPLPATALDDLEQQLRQQVLFQNDAIATVVNGIRAALAVPSTARGPLGAFLFLGPTGVGKTELAKALAAALFGSRDAMLRLDVGQFQLDQLAEAIRDRPRQVLLFDEIAKAHPNVLDALRHIAAGGQIAIGTNTVDLRDSVIIMTTSVGTAGRGPEAKPVGAGTTARARIVAAAKRAFHPDFLDRAGDLVVFNHLTKSQYRQIEQMMSRRSAVS